MTTTAFESALHLGKQMSQRREQLAKLVQDLQIEESKLANARSNRAQLRGALTDLQTRTKAKHQHIFALKMQLEGGQRARNRLKTPPGGRARWTPPGVFASEQRSHLRTPYELHVNFGGLRDLYSGFARNLSNGGMLVATCDAPEVGRRFAVEFSLSSDEPTIRCPVHAMWVEESDQVDDAGFSVVQVGVSFVGMLTRDREAIQRFNEAFASYFLG